MTLFRSIREGFTEDMMETANLLLGEECIRDQKVWECIRGSLFLWDFSSLPGPPLCACEVFASFYGKHCCISCMIVVFMANF